MYAFVNISYVPADAQEGQEGCEIPLEQELQAVGDT